MQKIIVCLDDKNGMMFARKRQSKDRVLCDKVREIVGSDDLNIVSYSQSLFPEANIVESFEGVSGFCFIENPKYIIPNDVDMIYIFKWNRHYPADTRFNFDMSGFHMTHTEDFAGFSHENITLEVYEK